MRLKGFALLVGAVALTGCMKEKGGFPGSVNSESTQSGSQSKVVQPDNQPDNQVAAKSGGIEGAVPVEDEAKDTPESYEEKTGDVNESEEISSQLSNNTTSTVTAAPQTTSLSLSVSTYNFGTVWAGLAREYTFTVTQTGNVAATQVSFSGIEGSPFTIVTPIDDECSDTIDGTCKIKLRYTGPASGGTSSATLQVSYFNGVENQQADVLLSGKSPLITRIETGSYHSCALTDGGVYCWGMNVDGQLGNGLTDMAFNSSVPTLVANLVGVTSISAGGSHTCAVANGLVYCWGLNISGQLGNGTLVNRSTPVQVQGLLMGKTVTSISAGFDHTCAVASDNKAYCWGGNNTYGALGNGTGNNSSVPVLVSFQSSVTSISAGVAYTCAINIDDNVYCWGIRGALGISEYVDKFTPVFVANLGGITSISAGSTHACAVASSNYAGCWGSNNVGRLGDGTETDRLIPVTVKASNAVDLSGIISISSGSSHTCAIVSGDNLAMCWGYNGTAGQLGNGGGTATSKSLYPVAVQLGSSVFSGVMAISVGSEHTCALTSDHVAYCWGLNSNGQVGDGTLVNRSTPIRIVNP